VAGSPAADASPYGVVLFPAVPYGAKPRHAIDIYVPSSVYEQLQQQDVEQQQPQQQPQQQQPPQQQDAGQQQQDAAQQQLAPVVFFCHGGIWATGGARGMLGDGSGGSA
jgi:acetyl esterase/lipase